ncbi:hypothetical protein BD311DRAFT_230400 [Dichomitus squalens]|uniref:Uncharacterized protein n=1 Tax=Dichomitus squalens TaxID=114155 RepID=A0A4Q9M755_9APHY|nr:hypothetical protein BD311DRAFT_230400 [Dichomitus squalens]
MCTSGDVGDAQRLSVLRRSPFTAARPPVSSIMLSTVQSEFAVRRTRKSTYASSSRPPFACSFDQGRRQRDVAATRFGPSRTACVPPAPPLYGCSALGISRPARLQRRLLAIGELYIFILMVWWVGARREVERVRRGGNGRRA